MLKNSPKLTYCGLTVILSNPSRFDKLNLLSANGGDLFNNFCLRPEYNRMQIECRLMEDASPFLKGTKCLLILGEAAMHQYLPETRENTLNEMRGSLFICQGIPTICSYQPQEAADTYANYEKELNPLSKEYIADGEVSEDDEDEGNVKAFSPTKRSNYAFWLRKDVEKCKQILRSDIPVKQEPVYHIYPGADTVISTLLSTTNGWLDFDIETDYEEQNLLCFAFSFDGGKNVYSVPVLNHNYQWAYSALPFILRALQSALFNNTVVAHNGAGFDFFVLASKYSLCIRRPYDTMLSMHRCYPDVEKSLGHCTSLWTWEKFHKDSDSQAYRTQEQMMTKLRYCGKDVYTMSLVRQAIQKYEKTIQGYRTP